MQRYALKYFSVLLKLKTPHLAESDLTHDQLCKMNFPYSCENAMSLSGNSQTDTTLRQVSSIMIELNSDVLDEAHMKSVFFTDSSYFLGWIRTSYYSSIFLYHFSFFALSLFFCWVRSCHLLLVWLKQMYWFSPVQRPKKGEGMRVSEELWLLHNPWDVSGLLWRQINSCLQAVAIHDRLYAD